MSQSLGKSPLWQQQRALKLHTICGWIDQQKKALGLVNAVKEAVARNRGTLLKNGEDAPEKLLRISFGSLWKQYKHWNSSGRSAQAFGLNYNGPVKKVPADLIAEFRRLCTGKGQQYGTKAYKTICDTYKAGGYVKGVGTFQDWWEIEQIAREKKGLPRHACPHSAPDFPFSYRALQNYAPSKAAKNLGNFGIARAKQELSRMLHDSSELRLCELFMLDDKRADVWVMDDISGLWKPVQPTLYFMIEVGCRYICSVVTRGCERILQKDVDAVVAHGLATMGMPVDYPMYILFEEGTVACTPAKKDLLEGLYPGRIFVMSTGMLTGSAYAGAFPDKAKGKPTNKGVMEAFMRRVDIMMSQLPGQSGNRYQNEPAELDARKNAATELAHIGRQTGKRMELPLLTLSEFTWKVRELVQAYNNDPDHGCQGFHRRLQIEQRPGEWLDTDKIIMPHEQEGSGSWISAA